MSVDTELLKLLPVAIYTTDADGLITFYNESAAEFWGVRPALNSDQWCGSWRIYTVEGERLPHDECPMALTLKSGVTVAAKPSRNGRTEPASTFSPFPALSGISRGG